MAQQHYEKAISNAKLLRAPEVAKRLQIHRATLDRWVEKGIFPPPRRYGRRIVVWPAEQVDQWFEDLNKRRPA